MRVVAGDLKGRRIESPDGDRTRPTTDKVREAVFNALGSIHAIAGSRVLDLFAGTGAMGIEALSRGAAHCTFVENDRAALAVLRRNLDTLGVSDRATVVVADARTAARGSGEFDLLIADPPYGDTDWSALLNGARVTLAVLEAGAAIGEIPGWQTVRDKRYGRTHVAFLRPGAERGTTIDTSANGTVESE